MIPSYGPDKMVNLWNFNTFNKLRARCERRRKKVARERIKEGSV